MDAILLQKQVRDNSEDLRTYLKDLKSWEDDMKRKESELFDEDARHEVPTVRHKIKKTDKSKSHSGKINQKVAERIKSYDYKAWDKFDVESECEKIESEKNDESSNSDTDEPSEEYLTRIREEAVYEKEKGNQFVREKKWDEAISCYTHAISCYPKDPIFYANRALCFLKKNDMHSAEADCTSALSFDPTYVKALQRRAAARAGLKQHNEALADLKDVLVLEPNNSESKKELDKIKILLGLEKGIDKTTSSSNKEVKSFITKVVEKKNDQPVKNKVENTIEIAKNTEIKDPLPIRKGEIIKPVQKLPHQRSKKPLRRIEIVEGDGTQLGQNKNDVMSEPSGSGLEKSVLENNDFKKSITENIIGLEITKSTATTEQINISAPEEKPEMFNFPVPKSYVQFFGNWKLMEKNNEQKFLYLKRIEPLELPNIFRESLEIDLFNNIISILCEKFIENNLPVFLYLLHLSNVKRFSALIMFMSQSDKAALKKLFDYCQEKGEYQDEINSLKKKFEV